MSAAFGVNIEFGPVPERLPDSQSPRPWMDIGDQEALVRLPFKRRVLVRGGRSVTVEWAPAEKLGDSGPEWILESWAVSLSMLQRGHLILHAASVEVAGHTVALAGLGHSGKSTTALVLRDRGHRLLVDELAVLDMTGDTVRLLPFARTVHVDPSVLAHLRHAAQTVGVVPVGKAAVQVDPPGEEPRTLDRVIILSAADVSTVRRLALPREQALAALVSVTSFAGAAPAILGAARYADLLTRLSAVPVDLVVRPHDQWSTDEVAAEVESAVTS